MVIAPVPGRVVWFYPGAPSPQKDGSKPIHRFAPHPQGEKLPMAALVCGIHGDGEKVNLAVFDAMGLHHPVQDVPLFQPGVIPPGEGHYCTWMPYQVGQAINNAAKTPHPGEINAAKPLTEADLGTVITTNPPISIPSANEAAAAAVRAGSIDIPKAAPESVA